MQGMSRPVKTWRLFIAVYPPPDAVPRIAALINEINLPPCRRTPEPHLHLTVHFVGDTPLKSVEVVRESLARAASGIGAFTLEPVRLIGLPQRGPKRLVALELNCPPGLHELHDRLVRRLARAPRAQPSRKYLPHITLCRFDRPGSLALPEAALDIGPFLIDQVHLMRSILQPNGARHIRDTTVSL
jgi:2'-5' RNA ligase